jgi:hypothetical protein
VVKPFSEFYSAPQTKLKILYFCKECDSERRRRWYHKTQKTPEKREKQRERQRQYRLKIKGIGALTSPSL